MEISLDIFIPITEMGYNKLIMGQFITHSLSMKHLLVTSLLQQQIHLETAHCRRQPVTFFYLYIKTANQPGKAGTSSGKSMNKHLIKRLCLFHIADSYLDSGFSKPAAGSFV